LNEFVYIKTRLVAGFLFVLAWLYANKRWWAQKENEKDDEK
jgi:hypothetical protein